MKNEGKPVPPMEQLEKIATAFQTSKDVPTIDFSNTANAFIDKSDAELKKTAWLFRMMNNPGLVSLGGKMALPAIKIRLPFFETIVKNTIFWQFCGGTTLLESLGAIDRLHRHNVFSVLDYGVEGKEQEEDFNHTMNEILRAIEFTSQHPGILVVSTKITGMARFALLEKVSSGETLTPAEKEEFKNVVKRVDTICHHAAQKNVGLYIDAEETWIQAAIDKMANQMMKRYNREKVIVYNTFQLYCKDRLPYLMASFDQAEKEGYLLGAKLVRGAYMDKERARAEEKGYPSPIQPNKEATDHDYNLALRFCVDNYEKIACCIASHNTESNQLLARLIAQKNIPLNHPHLQSCQLYGMSDNLTFNLAKAGYNAGKYVVYGQVRDVIPYLIRRTKENTSITGDLSRELSLINKEVKRRGM
jgi:proline dehydrogenase